MMVVSHCAWIMEGMVHPLTRAHRNTLLRKEEWWGMERRQEL